MVDQNEFRCKVCGGMLTIDDYTLGIAKCLNCSNKTRLEEPLLSELKNMPQQKVVTEVMVNMSEEDVKALNKARGRENAIYSIKCVIAILSLAILGIYASIMYFSLKGEVQLSNLELLVVSLLGIAVPAAFGTFSKLSKKKAESLAVHIMMLAMCFVITGLLVYFSVVRYFIS